jgi:hypothetical protein
MRRGKRSKYGGPMLPLKSKKTYQHIGKFDPETGSWDGNIEPPHYGFRCCTLVFIGILFMAIFLVVVLVPTFVGKSKEEHAKTLPSTTSTTSSNETTTAPITNTTMETTTFSGGPPLPTTQPFDELFIECPPSIQIPLGKSWTDTSITGLPTTIGGCDAIVNISYTDAVVGVIARNSFGDSVVDKRTLLDNQVVVTGIVYIVDATQLSSIEQEQARKEETSVKPAELRKSLKSLTFPSSQLTAPNIATVDLGDDIVSPPSPVLDVGTAQVVHAINFISNETTGEGGTQITIYSKALGILSQFVLATELEAPQNTACQPGAGQPQILYDHVAQRWIYMEVGSTNGTLCMYVSKANVPTSTPTNYLFYQFDLPISDNFTNVQLTMFNNYYCISMENSASDVGIVFVERQPILDQDDTTRILFVEPFTEFLLPVNVENASPQPSFDGTLFMRLDTNAVFIVHFTDIDFDAGSATYNSYLLGLDVSLPSTLLAPRLSFQNLYSCDGSPERIVGTYISSGNIVQWFELQYDGDTELFVVTQDASITDDGATRMLPSISMDRYGNIALLYNVIEANGPSLYATFHVQTDPVNTMREEFRWATALPPAGYDGADYGQFTMIANDGDPVEGRTFYGTGQFSINGQDYQVRAAQLRQEGDAIERYWVAQDFTCMQIKQCIQTIQLG